MRRIRIVVGWVLAFALQTAAAASAANALACQHAPADAAATVHVAQHVDHAAMKHMDHGAMKHVDHAAMKHMDHGAHAAASNCDCPAQCSCAHHCATGCVAVPVREVGIDAQRRVEAAGIPVRTDPVRDPQTPRPFRPPIVAFSAAA